jgi:hypothetical protein
MNPESMSPDRNLRYKSSDELNYEDDREEVQDKINLFNEMSK